MLRASGPVLDESTERLQRLLERAASAVSAAAATIPLVVGSTPAAGASALITLPGTGAGPGHPAIPQRPDAELRAVLREIDSANIEAIRASPGRLRHAAHAV
jgi:hypothetical protein